MRSFQFILFVCATFSLATEALTILPGSQINTTVFNTYPKQYGAAILTLDGDNMLVSVADYNSNVYITSYTGNVAGSTIAAGYGANDRGQQMTRLNSTHFVFVWISSSSMQGRICSISPLACGSNHTFLYKPTFNLIKVGVSRWGNYTTTPQKFMVFYTAISDSNSAYGYEIFEGDWVSPSGPNVFGSSPTVTCSYMPSVGWRWVMFQGGGNYLTLDDEGNFYDFSQVPSVTTFAAVDASFSSGTVGVVSSMSTTQITFQILNAAMTASVVDPFVVSYSTAKKFQTDSTPFSLLFTVTALKDGTYLVAWVDTDADGSPGVYGNVVSTNGTRTFTEDVRFSDYSAGNQSFPAIAAFDSGSTGSKQFVAGWSDELNTNFKIGYTLVPTPSKTPSPTPSISPSPSVTPTATATPSATASTTPSATASVTPTSTVTPSVTPSVTPTATSTPSVTPSVSPSVTPSITPTVTPSVTPSPSATPSVTPSVTASVTPSVTPTVTPTPSVTPSSSPSTSPSESPFSSPSQTPSITPTASVTPSNTPSSTPTTSVTPSATSSVTPSVSPSTSPSTTPSSSTTSTPSITPSTTPSASVTPSRDPPSSVGDNNDNSGVGTGGIIAMAVVIPVAALSIVVAVILYRKKNKPRLRQARRVEMKTVNLDVETGSSQSSNSTSSAEESASDENSSEDESSSESESSESDSESETSESSD